jgi:hypothetical protein
MRFFAFFDLTAVTGRTSMSSTNRREQSVSDMVQLKLDVDHWNRVNPDKEPIIVQTDLTDDVEWRINAPTDDEDEEAV